MQEVIKRTRNRAIKSLNENPKEVEKLMDELMEEEDPVRRQILILRMRALVVDEATSIFAYWNAVTSEILRGWLSKKG